VNTSGAAPSVFARLLEHERVLVVAAIASATLLSWLYLAGLASEMGSMSAAACAAMTANATEPWSAREFGLGLAMWIVMMIGMMLPSAAPTILLVTSFHRRSGARAQALCATGAFVLGYVLVWCGFSLVATAAQGALQRWALLSPMGMNVSPWLGGALLVAAGVHQATPWKRACLHHCRTPFVFIRHHWRPGVGGALRMGLLNGAFCLGCCATLMALLFVGGVMNLLWIAALTVFVAIEKLAPEGARLPRLTAPLLVAAGVAVWVRG
jgi:predicted metal-binding membrane protein